MTGRVAQGISRAAYRADRDSIHCAHHAVAECATAQIRAAPPPEFSEECGKGTRDDDGDSQAAPTLLAAAVRMCPAGSRGTSAQRARTAPLWGPFNVNFNARAGAVVEHRLTLTRAGTSLNSMSRFAFPRVAQPAERASRSPLRQIVS
jgi:hypothetical protein